MTKLAIITTHPIQYYAPWFRNLAQVPGLDLKVFYLWDFGVTQQVDPGFGQQVQWDIPLLEGYDYEFVPNVSPQPGTSHWRGLQNPKLTPSIRNYAPQAVLMIGYNYASLYRFLLTWNTKRAPLLFRGDSHRLVPRTGGQATVKRRLISLIFRRFAAFLYVGKANYDYFRYHHVPERKLFFAPHAIDNDRFCSSTTSAIAQAHLWKQELGIPNHHRVILFAGKFNAKKRPLDLLQAFIQAHLPNVSLLFVGGGELEPTLRQQAQGHPHIYFAPFQNQSLMPRTYAAADLVVLPSYGSSETWGLAINEALCLARPVIVSTHVGCAQDLVHPGKNGLIFPATDVQALTQALQTAFADPQRLAAWGEQGRQIVANYSYDRATQGLLAALEAVGKPRNRD